MDISQKQILIETKKLNKQFSNKFIVNSVINDLDINIYRNDFTVIMGKSGSGKSTLLYCLSGMDSVTRGNIILNNKDITLLSQDKLVKLRRKHLGFVFSR